MRKRNIKIRQLAMPVGTRIITTRIARLSKKMFATGDNLNNIVVWLIDDEDPVVALSSPASQQSEIAALAFSNSENELISGSSRGIINIWDMATSKISLTLKGHSTSVTSFTTFPTQEWKLASGSYDTNIKLWDLRTKDSTTTLKSHQKHVTSMEISPDAKMLLSGSEDGTAKIWDLRYPEKIIYTYTDHTGPVNVVKFNPQDVTFATGSSDKTAKYFRCEAGFYGCIGSTQAGTSPITAIEFSHDGKTFYTASNDSLKLWNMGKRGLLIDSVESPWKGVQDLCMIDGALMGIAWCASGLSVWGYYPQQSPQGKQEEQKLVLPAIHNNRREQLLQVKDQLNLVHDRINDIENQRMKKVDSRKDETKEVGRQSELDNKSGRSGEEKKRNFIEEIERKREEDARKKQEQQKRIADEEKRRRLDQQKKKEDERRKAEQQKAKREQQKAKREEQKAQRQRERREKQEREKRQRAEMQARLAQEQRQNKEMQIQRFNENMAKQQQEKYADAKHLLDSVLQEQRLEDSLNVSTFMGDKIQRQKFKQYDMISEMLKEQQKFIMVMNARCTFTRPILTYWSDNNIKNALYAMNESDISIVVDAIHAIISTPKYRSAITPDVAIPLLRKSAELMLSKHYRYVRNGIYYINQIVLMYKDELIKLKAFAPLSRADLSRQERMAKYDRLLDEFLNIFRMERLKKYSKEDQTQQLNQLAFVLYKNLEEILRKCIPKSEQEIAPVPC